MRVSINGDFYDTEEDIPVRNVQLEDGDIVTLYKKEVNRWYVYNPKTEDLCERFFLISEYQAYDWAVKHGVGKELCGKFSKSVTNAHGWRHARKCLSRVLGFFGIWSPKIKDTIFLLLPRLENWLERGE